MAERGLAAPRGPLQELGPRTGDETPLPYSIIENRADSVLSVEVAQRNQEATKAGLALTQPDVRRDR